MCSTCAVVIESPEKAKRLPQTLRGAPCPRSPTLTWAVVIVEATWLVAKPVTPDRYRATARYESDDDEGARVSLHDAPRSCSLDQTAVARCVNVLQQHDASAAREPHLLTPLTLRPSLRAVCRKSISITPA